MKKILFVCLVMLQLACNEYKNKDSFFINESLDAILSNYIRENNEQKIFYLFFFVSLTGRLLQFSALANIIIVIIQMAFFIKTTNLYAIIQ